jgi:hypothetical protein
VVSTPAFIPARRLYENFGFGYCDPFGEYGPDPTSVLKTPWLQAGMEDACPADSRFSFLAALSA